MSSTISTRIGSGCATRRLSATRRRAAGRSAAGRPRGPRARARDAPPRSAGRRARPAAARSSPVSSVRIPRGSASRRSATARATSSNVSPPATGSPSASPSHVPLCTSTPFNCTSRDAIVTAPVATCGRVSSSPRHSPRAPSDASNATSAASPACIERVGTTRASSRVRSAACSAAMITLPLFGSTIASSRAGADSSAATRSAVDGFIVAAAVDDEAPRLSKSRRFPSPADTATTDVALVRHRAAAGAPRARCVCWCMFAISTPSSAPRAMPSESARPGVVGVHVHLQGGAVADDQQRVADLLELRLERVCVEVVAFDDEHRAVAESRQLLVDRARCRARLVRTGASGDRSPATAAAMPRTISTSPPRLHRRHLPRAAPEAAPACARPRRRRRRRSTARSAFCFAASAIARIAVSIVPSTGFFTAR